MKTNTMKMEFRWEMEHQEKFSSENDPTRPTHTKKKCNFVSIYGHILWNMLQAGTDK
jgi:hypothetical protein